MKKEVVLYFLFTVILVLVNIPLLNALLLPKIISILIIIFFALPFCYYTYKQGNPLKILSKAFCFFLFFNALFVVGWFETPWPTPFLQHKELCLEYVAENKLYGGQPYCLEGPFSYLVAKGVDVLPGSFETGLQAVSMLLLFSIFFFSLKTESKLMKKKYLFMSTVFFVFYFMKVGQDDFTSIVATFFMVSGFYILFVAEWKYKEMVGSILLAISIFSKAQFLGPAVIIIFFYSLKYLDEKKELYLNIFYTLKDSIEKCKAFLHSIFVLLLPFIILFILLNVIYPNFIVYYYLAHINQATLLTMSQVFSSLLTFQYIHNGVFMIFYLSIVVSLLRSVHNKAIDVFSFVPSFFFAFLFILLFKAYNIQAISETYRIFFPVFFFLQINLCLFLEEFVDFQKRMKIVSFVVLGIFLLVFLQTAGGVKFSDVRDGTIFNENTFIAKLQKEVSYPMLEIPKPREGKILASLNYSEFLTADDKYPFIYLTEEDFDNIVVKNPDAINYPDLSSTPSLLALGVVDTVEEYSYTVAVNESVVTMNLYAGEYPVVIGPAYEDALTSIIYANKEFFRDYYCSVSIGTHLIGYTPSLPSRFVLFLHEQNVCLEMKAKVYGYYLENYDALCHRGKATANIVDAVFEKDKVTHNKECHTFIKTTDYMIPAHFQAIALMFFILLILLCQMVFVWLVNIIFRR